MIAVGQAVASGCCLLPLFVFTVAFGLSKYNANSRGDRRGSQLAAAGMGPMQAARDAQNRACALL